MLGELLLDLRVLELQRTKDRSSTELELRVPHVDGVAGLGVRDVQDLAGALLEWLVENGHQLPELPAMDEDLEDAEDEDVEPVEHTRPAQDQPVPAGVPEHTRERSDARWPDCASGWHDRCTSDRCGCPCHARRSVLEQSPER